MGAQMGYTTHRSAFSVRSNLVGGCFAQNDPRPRACRTASDQGQGRTTAGLTPRARAPVVALGRAQRARGTGGRLAPQSAIVPNPPPSARGPIGGLGEAQRARGTRGGGAPPPPGGPPPPPVPRNRRNRRDQENPLFQGFWPISGLKWLRGHQGPKTKKTSRKLVRFRRNYIF